MPKARQGWEEVQRNVTTLSGLAVSDHFNVTVSVKPVCSIAAEQEEIHGDTNKKEKTQH